MVAMTAKLCALVLVGCVGALSTLEEALANVTKNLKVFLHETGKTW